MRKAIIEKIVMYYLCSLKFQGVLCIGKDTILGLRVHYKFVGGTWHMAGIQLLISQS